MSFLKGLVNIIDVVDKAANDEFQITREGRRFKILVEGRFHNPSEPWVYDVTATDAITGTTSGKLKHFNRKEDGIDEAIDVVMRDLREKGLLGNAHKAFAGTERQCEVRNEQTSAQLMASIGRNEQVNRALKKLLAKQGFLPEPSPPSPPGQTPSTPANHHQTGQSAPSSKPSSAPGRTDENLHDIEPDVDGLYTSVIIKPSQPDPAQLDPKSTYKTWESPRKGFVYILNNSDFPFLPPNSRMRRGSEVDVHNVVHVFSQLGYQPLLHQNLTRTEILGSLDQTVRQINAEGGRHSSLCLFFMSHGNQEGVSGTDARVGDQCIVTRDEIKAKLSGRRCSALLGKPKLIFIQSCRGNTFTQNADELDAIEKPKSSSEEDEEPQFEMDYIPEVDPSESDEPAFETDFVAPQVHAEAPSLVLDLDSVAVGGDELDVEVDGGGELPNNSDIFVANATSNGYFSIRSRRDGAWFIQAISEIFLGYAHLDELNELMRKVTCLVTERYRAQHSDQVTKRHFEVRQTPAYESQGMRRRFFFLPKYPCEE